MLFLTLVLPFVPGLLWLWFFYTRDKYQPEPKKVVLLTFVLGGVAAAPAVLGEQLVEAVVPLMREIQAAALFQGTVPVVKLAALCFLVVGPIEELCKFAAVRVYAARHAAFDEPMDGIIYASAAALGFASVENVLYVATLESVSAGAGIAVLPVRALLAVPGHVFFASFWGFALGRRLLPGASPSLLPRMLLVSAVVHGAWDFLLLRPGMLGLFLGLFALLVVAMTRFIRWGRTTSPFRPRAQPAQAPPAPGSTGRRCTRCGLTVPAVDAFCWRCGGRVLPALLDCPTCGRPLVLLADRFCAACGRSVEGTPLRCALCGTGLPAGAETCAVCAPHTPMLIPPA